MVIVINKPNNNHDDHHHGSLQNVSSTTIFEQLNDAEKADFDANVDPVAM